MQKVLIVFLSTLFFSAHSVASDCPSNFITILEGKEQTSLYKKAIAEKCIGQPVIVTGKVYDVDLDDGTYEVRMDSIPGSRVFEVEMAKDPGADMLKIKKDDVIKIKGKLKRFGGYINRYINLDEGVCVACN